MTVLKLLAIVGLVSTSVPATAQDAATAARNVLNDQAAYADRMDRQMLDAPGRPAPTDPDQNPRRARRAQAAADLINAGDCPGALALAHREHDQRLADRIGLVCASVSVSQPTNAPSGQ